MMEENKKIVTRFAPSPTGNLHVGGVRAALFNYLYARKHGGTFILRIEDTDKERSKKEYENSIIDSLEWLGLEYDAIFRQSERIDIHRKYLHKLIEDGKAYVSKEEVKKEGDRAEVIRFKNPNTQITFTDLIRGDVTFDTTDLGDFVIAKDFDTPLFHLVVVVDDFEMGITHLIRGEDHISNTPRQILIQEAIGAPRPIYAHLPLVLGSDKSKLSKRHGALSTLEYRDIGYLAETMINFLALIGWNPGTNEEVFDKKTLIDMFSLEKVQKGGAVFNTEKLDWLNKQHIGLLSSEEKKEYVKRFLPNTIKEYEGYSDKILSRIIPVITERMTHFGELKKMTEEGELSYFFEKPLYSPEGLYWKKDPEPLPTKNKLDNVSSLLSNLDAENFTKESVKAAIGDYAEEVGRGNVFWPLRYALSGRDRSPDPFTLAEVFGKNETLKRIADASSMLNTLL